MTQPLRLRAAAVACAMGMPHFAAAQTAPAIPPSITTPDKVESSIGTLEYKDGAPSKETVAKAYDYLDLMHGVEAFVNAYQGASVAAIFKGLEDAGVPNNTALIFSELMDSKSLFLTANADTVYFWINLDVTKGPIVVETPPLALGVVDDMWFQWVTDFGLPGPDRGEGGKYLFVPPGYKGELPGSGYYVQKMRTTRATMLGRSFLENNDPKPVVALIKKTLKIYPYLPGGYGTSIGSALEGKATLALTPDHKLDWAFLRPEEPVKFTEGTGKVMNTVPPNDFSYFEMINDLVQKEPVGALDPEIMGSLAAVGIVKGKPFNPDARMKTILTDAAAIGTAAARSLTWRPRAAEGWSYYPNSAWTSMLWVGGYNFETPPPEVSATGTITVNPPTGARTLNSRTAMFFYATFITPAMIMRLTGIGIVTACQHQTEAAKKRVVAVHEQRPRGPWPDCGVKGQRVNLGVPEDVAEISVTGEGTRAYGHAVVLRVGGARQMVHGEANCALQFIVALDHHVAGGPAHIPGSLVRGQHGAPAQRTIACQRRAGARGPDHPPACRPAPPRRGGRVRLPARPSSASARPSAARTDGRGPAFRHDPQRRCTSHRHPLPVPSDARRRGLAPNALAPCRGLHCKTGLQPDVNAVTVQ